MSESETEEEGWDGRSGDEGHSEECQEVVVVEASGTSVSVKPLLCLPERNIVNNDETTWTRPDGISPTSGRNKVKTEDITRIRKRKELLSKEVPKSE